MARRKARKVKAAKVRRARRRRKVAEAPVQTVLKTTAERTGFEMAPGDEERLKRSVIGERLVLR